MSQGCGRCVADVAGEGVTVHGRHAGVNLVRVRHCFCILWWAPARLVPWIAGGCWTCLCPQQRRDPFVRKLEWEWREWDVNILTFG